MAIHKLIAPAVLGGTALCSPALAQQDAQPQGEQSTSGLTDIIVTAQKRAENLQDVPIAVTAVSSGELAGANIAGPTSLPRITPNLSVTVNATFATPYIRGVGSQYANTGLENSVSVYLDDLYVPRSTSGYFEFNDVERVEVLKGPQGTLYGRNATGGAIRIITADPTQKFEGRLVATYGTNERIKLEGMINIPLSDTLAFRFSAQHDEDDGYITNLNPNGRQRLFERDQTVLRAKLLFEPTTDLTIKLSGDYLIDDGTIGLGNQNLFNSLPEQIGAPGGLANGFYTVNNDYPFSGKELRVGGAALRIDYDLGSATLSSITGYRKEKNNSRVDLDATGAPIISAASYYQLTDQFTQEIQLTSNGSGPLKYVIGLYFLDEISRHSFAIWGAGTGGVALGGDGKAKTRSIAPYAQLDYAISDKFSVTAGLRYTQESKKLAFNRGYVGTPPTDASGTPTDIQYGAPCTTPGQIACEAPLVTREFSQFTPKLTLSYRPVDDVLLYATASRGFKSGGLNLPTFGAVDAVAPETLNAFELGWKTQFANIRFNGSGFYYDYKNLQVQITDQTTGGSRTVNAANAEIYGLEADVEWAPIDRLQLAAGGGYLHARYKNYVGVANVPCSEIPESASCAQQGGLGLGPATRDFSGNRIPNNPTFNGYVRFNYSIPLGGDFGKLGISSIYSYRSSVVFDDAGRYPQKPYGLLSARVGWTSANDRYSLAVYGDNLTGTQYVTFKAPSNTGGWQYPAPPRQIYVTAGLKF